MTGQIRAWAVVMTGTGLALIGGSTLLAGDRRVPEYEQPAFEIAQLEGAGLLALALLGALLGRRLVARLDPSRAGAEASGDAERVRARPYATLFAISFVALFVELVLIRYCGSQIRIFSFYKNVPLIGCFLGLGLGCCLAGGTWRQALAFLLWLVPVCAFLSAGSPLVSNALGVIAASASSEHILGDFVPGALAESSRLISQAAMAAFCVGAFVVITLLFVLLGRILGQAFEAVARLPGYTTNIAGSLAGILAFMGLSYLEAPPWIWFAAGLAPLLWWAVSPAHLLASLALAGATVLAVLPDYGDTVWSRYQKLVGHEVRQPGGTPADPPAYLVQISDVFYQMAVDRRPESLARSISKRMPHYDAVYGAIPRPETVLVVGAGTGNDVAAALRAGASRVDAVDIDPAILQMGRQHHPEKPYSDPRVNLIIDDARHAFRVLPAASYDAVIFGLLDSHTQLGMSSLRLDNYVFTLESLAEAKRLVRPGGHIVLTAAAFQPWFRERFQTMLESAVGAPVRVVQPRVWGTYIAPVDAPTRAARAEAVLPTDDWPFLYLPERAIPAAYLWVVGSLVIASLLVLRLRGLEVGRFTAHHAHLFALGAAFLLMEVHAINRLALLFGTTWLVSAVTIALVLLLITLANLAMILLPRIPYTLAYVGLALSLVTSFWLEPAAILGLGTGLALVAGALLLSPVFFAGLVFARSFRMAPVAATAMGANILGSVLGGWIEYGTMAFGMRSLVLLAGAFYLGSLLVLPAALRRAGSVG